MSAFGGSTEALEISEAIIGEVGDLENVIHVKCLNTETGIDPSTLIRSELRQGATNKQKKLLTLFIIIL